jgi:predicted phosphodiesterase
MRQLAFALAFAAASTAANAAESVWVQATEKGYEARLVTAAGTCPTLRTDTGDTQMQRRAPATADFPNVCSALIPAGTHKASIEQYFDCKDAKRDEICDPVMSSRSIPVPVANPQRILVVGDTGCRIKGATAQACNDADKWPFPAVAKTAAALKPDLVIHVGDYLYRESKCPAGDAGCAGSPWGDNWTTWNADFFDPAAPLLAAAPIVLVRGNHESCDRAGPGWTRLQGPLPYTEPCATHVPQFLLNLGGLTLAILDDNNSDEPRLDTDQAKVYAAELSSLAKQPGPVWLVHHRPIWAPLSGPLGISVGGNLTLVEASRRQAMQHLPPVPHSVSLMLGGHLHVFESINYSQDVPPQIVAGNGGDDLMDAPRDLRGSQFIGHGNVTVADGLSVGGFGFLLMTRASDGWIIDLYDPRAKPTGQCRFREPHGIKRGRLDCPGLKN